MAQLRQQYREFTRRDAEVIAIGPEDVETFSKWWRNEQMPFVGVPDPQHKVAKLYGQEVKLHKLGRMPAQLVVDKKGDIRYTHYGESMSDIPENRELLSLLDDLNREGAQR